MNSQFLFENIFNLTAYPIRDPNFSFLENNQRSHIAPVLGTPRIIDGDNHANTLRMLFNYIYHGIIDMKPIDHDQSVRLYYTDIDKWGTKEIEAIEKICECINKNPQHVINNLLIGDELYDRGKLDYLNLLFIMFPVLISNHGAEFVCCVELGCLDDVASKDDQRKFTNDPIRLDPYSPDFRRSALNLQKLIDKGVITKDKIKALYVNNYLPKLKLLEYSVSSDGKITVFTHAPSGNKMWFRLYAQFEEALINLGDENKIKELRDKLGIKEIKAYDPSSFSLKEEIAKLEYLNELFNIIKEKGIIHQLLEKKYDHARKALPNPFADFIWNRDRDNEILGRDFDHFNYANGHHQKENDTKGVYDLDCVIGKTAFENEGSFNFLYSYEIFGEDINHLIENKLVDKKLIEGRWLVIKDEIIKSFSKETFSTEDTNVTGAELLSILLDPNAIFSDYRIHSLKYLLIEKKQEFLMLLKDENNINYDKDVFNHLNKIINNKEIHTLLDIGYELLTNHLYKGHEKIILQKLVKSSNQNKNFLNNFYQILLLINEYKKHNIEININYVFNVLSDENTAFITLYRIHLHENLLNATEGCENVDYLKLLSIYTDGEMLKNVCWLIKMIDLFCTDWKANNQEKRNTVQRLVEFMCHPQFKEKEFQKKINSLKYFLPMLPKEYFSLLINYMQAGIEGIPSFNRFIDLISSLNFTEGWPKKAERFLSVIEILNHYPEKVTDGSVLVNLLYADDERIEGFVKLFKLAMTCKTGHRLLEEIFSDNQIMRRCLAIIDKLKAYSQNDFSLDAIYTLLVLDDRKFSIFSNFLQFSKEQNESQNDFTLSNLVFSNGHVMTWLTTKCHLFPSNTNPKIEAHLKLITKSSIGIGQSLVAINKPSLSQEQVNLIIKKLNRIVDKQLSVDLNPKLQSQRIVYLFACTATIFTRISCLMTEITDQEQMDLFIENLSDDNFFEKANLFGKIKPQDIVNTLKEHFESKMLGQKAVPNPSVATSPLSHFGKGENQSSENNNAVGSEKKPAETVDNAGNLVSNSSQISNNW